MRSFIQGGSAMFDDFNSKQDQDDFWNLDEYAKKPARSRSASAKTFSAESTSAVEINIDRNREKTEEKIYSDSRLTPDHTSNTDHTITRFIPPHNDVVFSKKHTIFEYSPENPLIKNVKIYSEKQGEQVFLDSNLFIRERRALLHRKAVECPHTSFYSYSPRYSQMSRAQLNWYLWWRENTRNGIFFKTDESYIILYAYELAATGENEDKLASLHMLCALLNHYSEKDINVVFRMMIRDLICDFCLLHALPSPIDQLKGLDRSLLSNAYLPEFFLDFSASNRDRAAFPELSSVSMYDYRRSKFFTPENSALFHSAINGAITAIINDSNAFRSLLSFTTGMYGCVTVERRPFVRMVNVVNRNIRFEITYYQLSNVQAAITDAIRYAENKLREHLGIKNKLHIMSVNPDIKEALDRFFAEKYPALPVIDRRRRQTGESKEETHEYDKLYDVPKTEISPEHALEIERDSWSTTKILTEAFTDEEDIKTSEEIDSIEPAVQVGQTGTTLQKNTPSVDEITVNSFEKAKTSGLFAQIKSAVGDIADLILLCKDGSPMEQRKFASSHALSLDEIADRINEAAVEVFGDIILEENGGVYRVIEDYFDEF